MAKKQSALQEETVKLRKKIEKKFKMRKLQELIENDKELDEVKAQTNQGGSGLERYDQSLGKSQEYFKDLRAANQKEKMREQQSM